MSVTTAYPLYQSKMSVAVIFSVDSVENRLLQRRYRCISQKMSVTDIFSVVSDKIRLSQRLVIIIVNLINIFSFTCFMKIFGIKQKNLYLEIDLSHTLRLRNVLTPFNYYLY